MDLSACDWRPSRISARSCAHATEADIFTCRSQELLYLPLESNYFEKLGSASPWTSASVQECRADDVRAVRLGPFESVPARTAWRSILSSTLHGLLADGDCIVAHAAHPATDGGVPIGFPPLHSHHIHVRKGDAHRSQSREVANHWFESHGDYPEGPSYGVGARSAASYVRRVPDGYCVRVSDATDVDVEAEINDVRVSGGALRWWLQLAFRVAPGGAAARLRPVSKVASHISRAQYNTAQYSLA